MNKKEKIRLDRILVKKGYAQSLNITQAMIMAGLVIVNEKKIDKSGSKFLDNINIRIKKKSHNWASRGGLKISCALNDIKINIQNKKCIDLGASTGGFTDVLLQKQAAHVYSVDVGKGQLAWKLVKNPKVTVIDKTNVRYLSLKDVDKSIQIIACDLSFISITKALDKMITLLETEIDLLALIKPQFELSKDKIGSGGIVENEVYRIEAVNKVREWAIRKGLIVENIIPCKIKGSGGNQEFFMHAKKLLF